jgi:hypothetical protein
VLDIAWLKAALPRTAGMKADPAAGSALAGVTLRIRVRTGPAALQ